MLFRQLEYLVALSSERHFGRAAEVCAVSQPTLSEAIRKLEVELDLPLVVRGHRFEGLTPEGEQIVVRARAVLAAQGLLVSDAATLRSGVTGTIRLGVVPTAAATVAQLTGPLCVRHPLVAVHMLEDLSSQVIATKLDKFEIDGGITYLDTVSSDRYRTFPLYREQYALLSADDPSSPRRTLTWREAAQLPLCALPSIMRGRRILDEYFAEADAAPTPRIETTSVASLYAHVRTGQWAAVVPLAWQTVLGEPPGLRYSPLGGGRPGPVVGLITNATTSPSRLVQAIEAIAAELDLTS